MGAVYCLAVPGRARTWAKAAVAAVVAVFGLARLYLGLDHPGDVLLAVAFAVAIAVTAFRYFTPNAVFPVAYRRGRTAHVDVTGRRGKAIRQAVHDQLGLTVTEIKPVGLESSAGSTPLRLRVEGSPEEFVFAKLYTKGHVRADRWYKLWRTILYGSLEDEYPVPDRAAPGRVRGLRPAPAAGHRGPHGQALRHRGDHARARVHAGHRIPCRRRRNRRSRRRRHGDRPGTAADPHAVGRRDRPPRHQAGQPDGPLRGVAADRRGLRPGAPVTVAAGGRPGQHDAGPGRAHRPAAGLPAGAGVLHRSRARRSVRRHPRGRQPDPAARLHETGPARPARRIPRPGPCPPADRAATLEHQAGRPGRRDARHHHRRRVRNRECLLPGGQKSGRLRPRLRHRPFDDPQRPGSPVRCPAALHRRAPGGLEHRRRGHRQRAVQLLAGLRSRRAPRAVSREP